MISPRIIAGLTFAFLSLSAVAAGSTTENCPCPPMDHARHEPPPSAFTDCKGKKEGAVIQHTTPNGDRVAAICVNSPKGLFALPEHPPRP
jgi:hypothetical protein